jgi:two-component SAPR family response regulator
VKSINTNFKSALVIDDDADLNLLLKSLLETIIPSVDCADDLASGMDAINRLKPNVIFVDNNLPDGQSAYFITQMKKLSPDSFIILISANDNFTENAREFGADHFLAKPLTLESIKNVLKKQEHLH